MLKARMTNVIRFSVSTGFARFAGYQPAIQPTASRRYAVVEFGSGLKGGRVGKSLSQSVVGEGSVRFRPVSIG